MTLEEAQAALVLAQEELIAAQEAKTLADSAVATASSEVVRTLEERNASATVTPPTSATVTQNVVVNGTFDDASAWSNIGMGSLNNTIVNSSIPRVYNGVLIGSYIYSTYVQQTGTFSSPTRQVTFSYDMSNNNNNDGNRPQADQYRVEFRTYNAAGQRLNYYNTGDRADIFGWTHFTASYTLPDDAVRWDIGFRLSDSGYWNGNFAGSLDNISLIATMTQATPEITVYDSALQAAYDAAVVASTQAVATQTAAQNRLVAAQAEVDRLTQLVSDLTPRLLAPTNLIANLVNDNVELTWTAPGQTTAGTQVERYAISWSTTNFTDNGWGWAHDQTTITIPLNILSEHGGLGNNFQFAIRADNDTLQVYSAQSNIVELYIPAPVPVVVPPAPGDYSAGEGGTIELVAPEGKKLSTVIAWYGSPTDVSCGADVSAQVSQIINGATSIVVNADNSLGDTCGGVVKVLILRGLTFTDIPVIEPTPTPEPTPTTTPEPIPTPTPSPAPEPTPVPEVPVVPPVVTPPVIEPVPQPQPIPFPVQPAPEPAPKPEPTPEPAPPTPEPAPPTVEPAPPTPEPAPEPPQPAPTPVAEPKPTVAPVPPVEAPKPPVEPEVKLDLKAVDPATITPVQQAIITQQAVAVLATAEQGSPAYEQALDALAVVAEADDPELPAELAALPLIGNVAGAVMDTFNAVGNIGADISPKERKKGQQVVVGTVIVGQMASVALLRR